LEIVEQFSGRIAIVANTDFFLKGVKVWMLNTRRSWERKRSREML
jgi:hypothetical protein